MDKWILWKPGDLEDRTRSDTCLSLWQKTEVMTDVKPSSYPCAVLLYWGEGSNGMFLVHEIVYPYELRE